MRPNTQQTFKNINLSLPVGWRGKDASLLLTVGHDAECSCLFAVHCPVCEMLWKVTSPVLKHNHDPTNLMQFQDQQGCWSMHSPFSMWIKLKVFHFMHSLSQTLYKHMVNGFMTRAVRHHERSKLVLSRAHGSSIYNLARSKSADSSISHCDSSHNDSKTSFTLLPSRILKRSREVWVNIQRRGKVIIGAKCLVVTYFIMRLTNESMFILQDTIRNFSNHFKWMGCLRPGFVLETF